VNPVIIIGAGMAGYALAREFRKLRKDAPLLIITADDGGFYSKPMLSNAFAQGKSADQLVSQTAAQMAAQLDASILAGIAVQAIDPAAKAVQTSAGRFEYDKLVLAVGARPVRLALAGDAAGEVMSVNHIGDYRRFREAMARYGDGARVAIIGAGLIGCEFADDLAGAGYRVTLIDPNSLPLAALAPPALSRGLRAALRQRGVAFRLGTSVVRVDRAADGLRATLADGTDINADIVLSAVGLRTELDLPRSAGLRTGRGIMVDAHGRTSADDIHALGDCAEYMTDAGSRMLPHVTPLMAAARAIAATLAGRPAPIAWQPMPVLVKTLSFPMALLPPASSGSGTWQETQYGERIICRYYDGDGTMVGFGVAPQEASIRQALLGELGSVRLAIA